MHDLLNFASILIFVVLMSTIIWYYRKHTVPYSTLPSVPILALFKSLIFTKIPKNMTPSSFYFQELINLCKKFHSDDLCYMWLSTPVLFIFGEEAFKLFLNEEAAIDRPSSYDVLQDSLGKGLITSKGDMWKKQRKMLNPLFHTSVLKDKVPILNKQADILVKQLLEVPHEKVDIHKYLKFCTFSIICETIIGLDIKERQSEAEQFIRNVSAVSDKVVEIFLQPWIHHIYNLNLLPSSRKYFKQIKDGRDFGKKVLMEMLEAAQSRQNKMVSGESLETSCSGTRRSFAQTLVELHLKDPSCFNLEYMVDELSTIISAGYDTLSYTLMWCLFLLGHHQDVQDQVFNEMESVTTGEVSFDDLSKLTYMECVIKETLRLYPTVPIYGRHLEKTTQLGKYTIPKGIAIFFFSYLYHRNPEIYPDPDKFDPERFSEERADKRPWTYVVFAEGKRSCIGKKLALMEVKIILAHVLRHFKVTSLDRIEDIKLNWNVVLNTVEPVHVRLHPREQRNSTFKLTAQEH